MAAFTSKFHEKELKSSGLLVRKMRNRSLLFLLFIVFSALIMSFIPQIEAKPSVSGRTKGFLTLNGFEKGKDGGGPSECDGHYHSDDIPIVALSTGWFNNMKRCFNNITIYGNGKSVTAMVIDECDSTMGCDLEHDYQPPCDRNIVDASRAVWKALGVPEKDWGGLDIHWSDA